MRKSIIFFISLLSLVACKKDLSTLNVETKRPAAVPAPTLFSYATKQLSDVLTSASVNTNVFRFTVSHWAMSVYQDEAQYDFSTRNIPQGWWTIMYRNVLQNLKQSSDLIKADATLVAGEKANKLAILDIMQVYAFSVLVNSFGNVPYSEALDQTKMFPKYDDAKTISLDLIKRLNNDISQLNASSAAFKSSEDLIYRGNVDKWIKFGNTLRMKLGIILADVDNETAKAAVEASAAAAISSPADNGSFTYLAAAPSQSPLYVDIVTGGRADYVAANDLMSKLTALSDPRKSQFFGTSNAGIYAGGVVGKVNTYADFSKPSAKVYAPDATTLLADYVEAEFYRAEAVERGYAVAGTAESHYNNAITASIIYWGGTAADAAAYLEQPAVAYSTASGTWREKIGTQKWIALYNRPYDGWTELRRLDFPKITAPVGAKSNFPTRFPYPNNEQQLNGASYTAAAAAIGGDKVDVKLFWDKF
ncbi:MAG TPA: SusD/RagB family nutrient-binding outer membrane lipoprotein [Daejeonella sp.]|nr:SusD/RagB family nutrient-binding outer membrane lipoprotein [Daejeonella sp.]